MNDTADTAADTRSDTPPRIDGLGGSAPAIVTQDEWNEVLTFVREMRPLVAQLGQFGEQLKGGGLAGIAAAVLRPRS